MYDTLLHAETTDHSQSDDINILIVDDNRDLLYALKLSLEKHGLKIFTTTSPSSVIDICVEKNISIMLLDIQMPEINGIEVLELLKNDARTRHILVVLITGHSANSQEVVSGLRTGAVDFLFKPLDLYITTAKIDSLVTLVNYQRQIRQQNTELQQSQHELFAAVEQIKKSKAIKENFLANMSHEIRTPLTAIIGLSNLLKKTSATVEQQEIINLLEHSTKALLGLVNDILDSEKIDAGKINIIRSETDIVTLVNNLCSLTRPLAQEKGLWLNCEIADNVPALIQADGLRLNQILMNLINNSIKFTQQGGVTVKLDVVDTGYDKILLQFQVIDTGIGIPDASLDRIFDRFEQIDDKTWQKFGGTGLGLSIVKRLIELKGGTLKVRSSVGQGTTFTFTNWFAMAAMKEVTDCSGDKVKKFKPEDGIKVLLAEDNAINQFLTAKILRDWNIEVDVAVNGQEAFDKLNQKPYHLILMDTHMPVMNGYEATQKIRTEIDNGRQNIPIITFSASVMENDKLEARKAGVDDFISKPFELPELYRKICYFVNNSKAD